MPFLDKFVFKRFKKNVLWCSLFQNIRCMEIYSYKIPPASMLMMTAQHKIFKKYVSKLSWNSTSKPEGKSMSKILKSWLFFFFLFILLRWTHLNKACYFFSLFIYEGELRGKNSLKQHGKQHRRRFLSKGSNT